jgi:hypothetical protein
MDSEDFGALVCETLGISPDIVSSVVIEAFPDSVLTITLEVRAKDPRVVEWAKSEEIKKAGRVILMEMDEWIME